VLKGELYGKLDEYTKEWVDGLASSIIRKANKNTPSIPNQKEWIVFDGPVDAKWIENMNTVLDDNRMLCLANGKRIKLRSEIRMLFEAQNLVHASPATVSRCGMIFIEQDNISWESYFSKWLQDCFPEAKLLNEKMKTFLENLAVSSFKM